MSTLPPSNPFPHVGNINMKDVSRSQRLRKASSSWTWNREKCDAVHLCDELVANLAPVYKKVLPDQLNTLCKERADFLASGHHSLRIAILAN